MPRLSSMKNSGSNTGLLGNYLANPESKLKVYNLSWDQPTIFKPIPCPTADRSDVLPWRDEEDQDMLTPWVHELSGYVRAAGTTRRITFNANLPADQKQEFSEGPYELLYRVVRQKAREDTDEGAKWEKMTKGKAGEGPKVPGIKSIALLQGLLYSHNGKDYIKDPRAGVMLCLSPTATNNLSKVLTMQTEEGHEIDDLFCAKRPKLLHFSRSDSVFALPPKWDCEIEDPKDADLGDEKFKSHVVRIINPPQKTKLPNKKYSAKSFIFWKDAIRVMSAEEQLDIICSAFDFEILSVVYRMSPYEHMLPNWVRSRMTGSSVSLAGLDEDGTSEDVPEGVDSMYAPDEDVSSSVEPSNDADDDGDDDFTPASDYENGEVDDDGNDESSSVDMEETEAIDKAKAATSRQQLEAALAAKRKKNSD